ncbi:MAG: hypothetical protein AAGH15_23235 [Myxococcota bacterium]
MRVPARFDGSAVVLWTLALLVATALSLYFAEPPAPPEPDFVDLEVIEERYGLPPLPDAGARVEDAPSAD